MAFKFQGFDFLHLDASLTEEELLVRRTTREFVDANVIPIIEECFREGRFPRELVAPMGKLGFYGASLEGYGCAGMSNVEYGLVMQELERGDSGLRSFVSVQSALVMYPIFAFGSEEQKNAWLPALASGEKLGCFGLTEPGFGSNPAGMTTRARKSGDEYILNGEKMWITSGSIADVAVIWARLEDEGGAAGDGAESIRGFLVETNRPGFSAHDIHGKWSLRASVTSGLTLEDVRVPAANLLPGATSLKAALKCLNQARYGISWGAIGAAMDCYSTALNYAKTQKAISQPADRQPSTGAGKAGVDGERNCEGAIAFAACGAAEGCGQGGPPTHFHGQAKQRMDGSGMRAPGARHSGRERRDGRFSRHAPQHEPGIGEDVRGHARHSYADPGAELDGDRGVLTCSERGPGGIQVLRAVGLAQGERM